MIPRSYILPDGLISMSASWHKHRRATYPLPIGSTLPFSGLALPTLLSLSKAPVTSAASVGSPSTTVKSLSLSKSPPPPPPVKPFAGLASYSPFPPLVGLLPPPHALSTTTTAAAVTSSSSRGQPREFFPEEDHIDNGFRLAPTVEIGRMEPEGDKGLIATPGYDHHPYHHPYLYPTQPHLAHPQPYLQDPDVFAGVGVSVGADPYLNMPPLPFASSSSAPLASSTPPVAPSFAPLLAPAPSTTKSRKQKRQFVCRFCYREFSQQGGLQNHERTHTNERPYKCADCQRSFSQRCNLIRHIKVHAGIKEFQCNICGGAFNRKWGLGQHLKNKHGLLLS